MTNRTIHRLWRLGRGTIGKAATSVLCVKDVLFDKKLKRDLDSAATMYSKTGKEPGTVRKEMIRAYLNGGFLPEECAKLSLSDKSKEERAEYISDIEMLREFVGPNQNKLPSGKYAKYQLFADYFKREVIHIDYSEKAGEAYNDFLQRNESFILKPIRGKKGQGVSCINGADAPTLEKLHDLFDGECILEELIRQGDALGQFHPKSVNTVRIASCIDKNGQCCILFALFRVGLGTSVVDNVGSGGLITMIDPETGIVVRDAIKGTETYAAHPDTGVVFRGFRMPAWQDLLDIVRKAHLSYPQQKLIGWDFAWTDSGWVMVEANPAPSFASWQTLADTGIRPLLREKGLL